MPMIMMAVLFTSDRRGVNKKIIVGIMKFSLNPHKGGPQSQRNIIHFFLRRILKIRPVAQGIDP